MLCCSIATPQHVCASVHVKGMSQALEGAHKIITYFSLVIWYNMGMVLFTFSTVTTSNTHKLTDEKYNAPSQTSSSVPSVELNATTLSFALSFFMTSRQLK